MKQWNKVLAVLDRKFCFYLVCLLLPFVLLPLGLSPLKELRCLYALLLIASYWVLEPVPIYVSALLPIILFPLLGILNSSEVCTNYTKEIVWTILGSIISMALAVEESKLHERIALKILLLIGTELKWLLGGVMLSTMFLSMWLVNTATTAMMLPIVQSLLKGISPAIDKRQELNKITNTQTFLIEKKIVEESEEDEVFKNEYSSSQSQIRIAFLLSIFYSSNIGGTGTLIGTGPNFALLGLIEEYFPGSDEINFASWMIYSVPGMVLCIIIAWFYLWRIFLRNSSWDHHSKEGLHEVILKKYKDLGPLSFCQIEILILFIILLLLWLTRDPKIINGWSTMVGYDKKVGNSWPAIAISFLLFVLPSDIKNLKCSRILHWEKVQRSLPWGMLLLVGSGLSLADATQKSGLSIVIEKYMNEFKSLPPVLVLIIVCTITTMATEIFSNLGAVFLLFPIVSQVTIAMRTNPLYILLPLTITSSFAFMLPVGTPPNAIVYASGHLKISDMVTPGLYMNIICVTVQLLMINSWGILIFDVHNFPNWANSTLMANNVLINGASNNSTETF